MNIKLSLNLESTLTSLTEKWRRQRASSCSSSGPSVNETTSGASRSYVGLGSVERLSAPIETRAEFRNF